MYRIAIIYNHPAAPDAFDDGYAKSTLRLVKQIGGLHRFATGRWRSLDGAPPSVYAIAELYLESQAQAVKGFSSPPGHAPAMDAAIFVSGAFAPALQ